MPRVALDDAVGGIDEVEALEQVAAPAASLLAGHVEQPPDVLEVLGAGQALVDGGVLAGQADPGLGPHRFGDDVDAVDERSSGVGAQERGEDAHGRRLAGAVGAEQADDLGARDDESTSSRATVSPKRLVSPSARSAG